VATGTSLDSSGGYREFIPSFRDPGEVTLNMNFTRDVYVLLNTDFEASTTQNFDIVFPDAQNTSLDFDGYVTGITIGIPTDDKVTMDVTIKITGVVTLTS
jgi:predicted secreted protein